MFIFLGEKFDLKLLNAGQILLHEEVEDNRSERLYERFVRDKVLYNPLIVGRFSTNYMLIDGANRFNALKKIGAKTILAQIVDYNNPRLKLKSWYHFVYEMTMRELKDYLKDAGLPYINWNIKDKIGKVNYIGVAGSNGNGIKIKMNGDFTEMLSALCSLNRYYEGRFSYTRIASDSDFSNLKEVFPGEGLLFIYPPFAKKDIIKIAESKNKVPAGITRHLLPNRVLHVKYDIDKLMEEDNLNVRNSELNDFIKLRVEHKKVRLYKEPVLIFDE